MVAKTAARPSSGHHCRQVKARSCGLPAVSARRRRPIAARPPPRPGRSRGTPARAWRHRPGWTGRCRASWPSPSRAGSARRRSDGGRWPLRAFACTENAPSPTHTQNACESLIYTLDHGYSSCGTCAAWSPSWTPAASPMPPSSSASPRRPSPATCGPGAGPGGAAAAPHQPEHHARRPPGVQVLARARMCWRRPTTWSARRPPGTPGCASATPGRRWAGTPRSSSAAGPPATRTSSCT